VAANGDLRSSGITPESSQTPRKTLAVAKTSLHGLGGIGKTQIALEYAHRYEQLYSAILWVDAKDRTVLESSGVRILQQLVYHYATRSPFTSALPLNSVSQVVSIFLAPSSRR